MIFDNGIDVEDLHYTAKRNNNLDEINKYEDEIKKLGGKLSNLPRSPFPVIHQTIVTFPNGYGISFVRHSSSYGLEAAILTYEGDNWDITYNTPITDDVIGYLNDEEVLQLLEDVSKLPNRYEGGTE